MLKPFKFNPNDPKLWKNFDPNEKAIDYVDDKPEGYVNFRKGVKQRSENLEYRKKLSQSVDKKSKSETSKKLHQDLEFKLKHRKGIDQFLNDGLKKENWKNNVNNKRINTIKGRQKPIMTPNGIFDSLTHAANFYNIKKSSLRDRMRFRPDQYYYITKEEYDKLKK